MRHLRIVIAGQKFFGRAALELALQRGHEVLAVSSPDDGGGAGHVVNHSASRATSHSAGHVVSHSAGHAEKTDLLKAAARLRGIPWIAADRLCAATMPPGCDLIIAAHCHRFLSAATRRRAELGALGYHPSLLPLYRGRSAVEWSLRFGERTTGGTAYWLDDSVDGGPIAAQDWCHIRPGDTARELWRRDLAPMGLRLFARVLTELEHGLVTRIPQDAALATWEPAIEGAPKLHRPDVPMLGDSRFQTVAERR